MDPLIVRSLLGSEMAQDDKNFLHYCVRREDLLAQLSSKENSLVIVNAARGSGKSGLLLALENDLMNAPTGRSVTIKKYYSDVLLPTGEVAVNQYINFWKNTILGWVVSNLGASIKFALTDDEISAVELAEKTGEKQENLISSTLKRLKLDALPVKKLDYDPKINESQIQRLIEASKKDFWILIDEMDDHYTNSYSNNNLLLGLLQASKSIATKFPGVFVRTTIRPHILTILKTHFDIAQKFRQNIISISWNPNQMRSILVNRISHFEGGSRFSQMSFDLTGCEKVRREDFECQVIGEYIEDFDMKFAKDRKSKYRALFTLSFARPRWMLEFVELALEMSPKNFASITSSQKAMHEYGNNRIQFLIGEHRYQYPELELILNHLSGKRKIRFGSTAQLKNWLVKEVVDEVFEIKDVRAKEAKALEVANSLYMIEFIRPKENLGGKNDHRFYSYNERPELLNSWHSGTRIQWEMHPTFSRAFNLEDNNTFRVGSEIRVLGEKTNDDAYENIQDCDRDN